MRLAPPLGLVLPCILAASLRLASPAAAAPEPPPLTRAQVVAGALAKSSAARAGHERARAERAEGDAERLPPPKLTAEARQIPLEKPWDLTGAAMLMLQLSQQFPAPGSQGAREDARLARAKAEDAMADDRARLVARDAAHAFADWAEATERCRIHDEHVRVAGAVLAAAEARIAGGGKLTDVAQARVALQRVQADAATDRARLAAAASRVAALLDRPMDAPLGTPVLGEAQVPSQPPSELAKQARAARPELRAVRALVESSERDETAAKREALWPEFEVGLAYNPATTPMPFHGYGVSVSMTLPWLWGAASSRRDATRAREQAARLEADAARLPIDAEIATAAGAARSAGTKLRLLRERVLPASRESFELVLAGYASGGTEIRDVLDARRARIDTEEEIVLARAELEHALADLEAAVGAPLALAPLSTLPLDEKEASDGR